MGQNWVPTMGSTLWYHTKLSKHDQNPQEIYIFWCFLCVCVGFNLQKSCQSLIHFDPWWPKYLHQSSHRCESEDFKDSLGLHLGSSNPWRRSTFSAQVMVVTDLWRRFPFLGHHSCHGQYTAIFKKNIHNWLVVSTPQLGLLFPIYGKIKNVPNHQPG